MGKQLVDPLKILADVEANAKQPFAVAGMQSEHLEGGCINDIISLVNDGNTVHFMTDGAWSQHQLVMSLIFTLTGPAHLLASTYALSETSARCLCKLKDERQIKTMSFLIDNRVETRTAGSLQLLQQLSDKVVMDACHAKATVIIGERLSVVITGSANWTENRRKEIGSITCHPAAVAFHRKWISDAIGSNGK